MDSSFREHYASLSDEELLHIAGDRRDLREEAGLALDAEIAQRGLTSQRVRAKKRDELRMEIREARAHHPKRKKSKYFVARMNLRAYFIGLAGLILLMVLTHRYRVREEWEWPLVVVYLGVLIACLAVQPWVRRTLSFWFSLGISVVPQFVVAHWLAVDHPANSNSGLKGSGFLSMLAGYALGVCVFVLLQRLKPGQGPNAAQ